MENFRPLELSDYFAILRRRKWLILVPLVVISVATFFVLRFVPNIYRSETFIMVEQQKIPVEYVRPTVQTDLSVYLQTLKEQVLSRTRLQFVIEELRLREKSGAKTIDEEIENLREHIDVELVRSPGRVGLAGFKMFYEGRTPELAQSVLRVITSLLIDENLRIREQQATSTTRFLGVELEGARVTLQEQEKRLSEFKIRYFGELPQQQQTNLALLGQLNTQLGTNTDALNRLEQEKTYLQSLLDTQRAIRRQQDSQLQSVLTGGADGTMPARAGSGLDALDVRLKELRTRLVNFETRYTPDHPDVVRLKAEIERLRNALPAKEDATGTESDELVSEDLQEAQLTSRLESLEVALNNAQRERTEIQEKIQSLQIRLNISPVREQQLADVTRDYKVAEAQYDDLLRKRNEAKIAANLEMRQQGQRFRILDPPSLPLRPSKPNRPLLNFAGVGTGLLLGLGLAALKEIRKVSLWSARDVTYYLNLPTLATIPRIKTSGRGHSGKKELPRVSVVRG